MNFLISLVLSLLIGFFWIWWYYRQDVYEKEPKRLIFLIFVLSMPLSILAGLLEYSLDRGTGLLSEKSGFFTAALFYLVVVSVTEELAKFFVVFTLAYPNKAFNEPMDGIIYSATAAIGFASFENVFYVLDRGPLVLLLRGPFSTLGHILFSALWGSALGLALKQPRRLVRTRLITVGLILAILAHGVYNSLISLSQPFFGVGTEWLGLSGVVFLAILYYFVWSKINYALHISDFNPRNQAKATIPPPDENVDKPRILGYAPNPHRYKFVEPDDQPKPKPDDKP